MSLAIRERFGKPVMDSEINAYPSFEDLAKAPEEALRKCGLGYRAENLLKTARLLADGKLDLETIGSLPTSEISRILQTLPGISERIANCILLYSYDRLDVVPIDLHTNRLLYYMRNGSPDELTVYAGLSSGLGVTAALGLAGRQLGPYAGYVGLYTEEFARRLPSEGKFLPSPPSIIRE
jgi:N-glycosylase/DNA lyase